MITKPASSVRNNVLRKLALYGGIALFVLYVGLVAAGYSWLHFVRKNDQVRLADVALARLSAIRNFQVMLTFHGRHLDLRAHCRLSN